MSLASPMQYQHPPKLWSQYLRALLARSHDQNQTWLPHLEAALIRQRPDADKVAAYANVCGFRQSELLPFTYPHILAFPLHLELMLHRDFPLAPMGLVHIRNQITQYRPIHLSEPLDVRCFLGAAQQHDKGLEFDILTEVRSRGELLWESVSTNLSRQPKAGNAKPRQQAPDLPQHEHQQDWQLPADLGRCYARVSGDSNPIHLHPLSARLFGFRQPIAHGMWTKARTAAALSHLIDGRSGQLTVQFKQPIFLPSDVTLHCSLESGAATLEVRQRDEPRVHMTGQWQPL